MALSPKDVVPLTKARAQLTGLFDEVSQTSTEKLITKNGESCAALIGAERLEYYPGWSGNESTSPCWRRWRRDWRTLLSIAP